jgi:hypothetical protein
MAKKRFTAFTVLVSLVLVLLAAPGSVSQDVKAPPAMLLTVFMKHDQSKTLAEINGHLDKTGFWKKFPPEGVEIVSWYVMMGIGQVVTLRVPPEKLRAVNLVLEENAWGAYRTEFYATYDFRPVWESTYQKR